jgi:hypothetical protein
VYVATRRHDRWTATHAAMIASTMNALRPIADAGSGDAEEHDAPAGRSPNVHASARQSSTATAG